MYLVYYNIIIKCFSMCSMKKLGLSNYFKIKLNWIFCLLRKYLEDSKTTYTETNEFVRVFTCTKNPVQIPVMLGPKGPCKHLT